MAFSGDGVLAQDVRHDQGDDSLFVVAEPLLECPHRVLPQRRPSSIGERRRHRVRDMRALDQNLAVNRMGHVAEVVAMGQLRVGQTLSRALDLVRAHTVALQPILERECILAGRPRDDERVQFAVSGESLSPSSSRRDHGNREGPRGAAIGRRRCTRSQSTVGVRGPDGVHAVRRPIPIVVALAVKGSTIDRLVEQCRRQKVDGGLPLREVDVLTLPCAPDVIDGRDYGERQKPGRHVIGIRREGASRRTIGPAREIGEAGHRRRQVAESGEVRQWTGLTPQRT